MGNTTDNNSNSNNNYQLNTSLDILKRAQQEGSLDLYSKGLEQLLQYMKKEEQQSSSQLETLHELAHVYMLEAETLKQQKQNQTTKGLIIPSHLDPALVHQIT